MKLAAALICLLGTSVAFGQSGQVIPSISLHPDKITLADTVQMTLALEGPAPLRFDLPKESEKLLIPNSAAVWQIRPQGKPSVSMSDGGRERWEQKFRLSPFIPGEKVTIAFVPLKVTAGTQTIPQEITFPSQEIRVQTAIIEANAENARPITGIEQLPALPPPPPDEMGWKFLAALGAIFAAVLIVGLIRKYRTQPPPLPPIAWAVCELDRLASPGSVERLAAILREFIERHSGIPARKQTTAELLAAGAEANWSVEKMATLREILETCDRAKFAGVVPNSPQFALLFNHSRHWIESFGEPLSAPN